MSKIGKICFTFSLFAFVLLLAARWVYGGWHPTLWIPLGLWAAFLLVALVKDRLAIRAFAGLRTTKHGANMGVLIVGVLVALICVNFLAARNEKKFDWTSEKLYSLSDQSIKAAQALKIDSELTFVYGKDQGDPSARAAQHSVKELADMYVGVNHAIHYVAYDGLTNPEIAKKFEYNSGPFVFYASQGERKVKIDPPTEEGVTRALIKLEHQKKKTIYFTRGHGEPLLDDRDANGLLSFATELSVTFEVKPLILFEAKNKVPDDADVVAVIGPKEQFLEYELAALREYARRGGHLFIALDPGTRNNLALLTKTFGVEFNNDFVFDLRSSALKSAPSLVLGTDISHTSEITRGFPPSSTLTLFELASSLKKDPDAPASLKIDELIKTDAGTASVPELKEKIEYHKNGPHIIAMTVEGKLPPAGKIPALAAAPIAAPVANSESKEFSAVIVGDSNFVSNQWVQYNLNRDLAANSVAWLAKDTDLISVRPKEPKSSRLVIPRESQYMLMLGLFGISVVLFGSGARLWWLRRVA